MKKVFILSCAVMLTASMLCPVVYAADRPVAKEIHSAVAYGTPTIDGALDECYLQSQRIDYELQPVYLERKGLNEPISEEEVKELYGWDTGIKAYSYMLWDESNIYVYVSVSDTTSGIVDFDVAQAEPGFPEVYTYQDGVWMGLYFGEHMLPLFAERGGRFFGTTNAFSTYYKHTSLQGFGINSDEMIGLNADCFKTIKTYDGYITEYRIPLTDKSSAYLSLGAQTKHTEVIYNYIDTLPYGRWNYDELKFAEPGFDGGVWYSEVIYNTKYNLSDASDIIRYADLVGTDSGDVNGDGAVDVRDIVRLMKNIASDITPEPVFDVSLDGELDSRDLVALMRKIAVG